MIQRKRNLIYYFGRAGHKTADIKSISNVNNYTTIFVVKYVNSISNDQKFVIVTMIDIHQ